MKHQPSAVYRPLRLSRLSSRWIAFLLFVGALLPRLPGLHRFLTSDEHTNIVIAGSDVIRAMLAGNLRETYWHFYPGVTMSWLDALGLGGQYLVVLLTDSAPPSFSEFIYRDILSLLVAARLPYVVLTALAVPAIYLLARQLLPERIALLGALLVAFAPFFLAHSRVAHGDAPVAVFMIVSTLAFFVHTQQAANAPFNILDVGPVGWSERLRQALRWAVTPALLVSAIAGGLAALTKAPGQFMAIFIILVSLLYGGIAFWRRQILASEDSPPIAQLVTHWLAVIVVWGTVSLIVFVLLWPSMWVDPWGTFAQMWQETFGKVEEGHLVYFFGEPTLDPGLWFYLVVIPFRLTPVVMIGTLLSLLILILRVRSTAADDEALTYDIALSPLFLLWFFIGSLLLFGNLSPKKQDRYLLPLFPALSLVAAVGWIRSIDLVLDALRHRLPPNLPETLLSNGLLLILLLLHAIPVFTYYPYYLTYFNPLLGGPRQASEITLMGWGEGMEQVAAYLNTKPNAEDLYVASTPAQTLLPYFAGTGENFYTNDIAFRADYVVLYLAQMQRLAPSPEIVRYFQRQEPEETIEIEGVTYAKIYRHPPQILPEMPANATPVNVGLGEKMRLAGYSLDPDQPEITLYWHALAPIENNYTISVRAYNASGEQLAQQDQWPLHGLLPTSQWRQGDYVADTHTLDLPPEQAVRIERYEIVVYNAETGATLGPPITIVNDRLSIFNE